MLQSFFSTYVQGAPGVLVLRLCHPLGLSQDPQIFMTFLFSYYITLRVPNKSGSLGLQSLYWVWYWFLKNFFSYSQVEGDKEKSRQIQKFAPWKKSTFAQSSLNFVKPTTSFVDNIDQVSWWLDKNCGFFSRSQFLDQSTFFLITL